MFATTAVAEERDKIAEVVIKGNRRIETAAILNVVKSKPGDFLYPDKVDADVRAIYALGNFNDVQADSEKVAKGVALVFTVVEKPIVREVRFEGNKELGQDKLRETVEVRANTVYSAKDLAKSVKKLKKLYADEGYYLAEIEPVTEERSGNDVRVTFKITEGKKILIKTIRFEGNRAFPDKRLKKTMETREAWMFSWLTGAGTYKEDVLKNDVNLIADLYFDNGYVNVKVGEPKVSLLDNREGLVVDIGITEGDQFRVGTVNLKGDLLADAAELSKKLTVKTADVFSRSALRAQVFSLTDFYADKGYAFANVTPLTKVNPETKTIDLTFDMEKGEKVSIDWININGNTKTRDKVIRRELKLAEGDVYSSSALRKSKQNLMNLGFFEEANLATAKGSGTDKLNLNVDVKEKATGTFSIGAGYSSLDGIVGQGSVQQANFFGLGLKANASASIGSKTQTYNLGLTDPYFLDSRWTLGADVYRTERDYNDYTRRATGGDVKAGYPLSDTISTFWLYKYEEKEIFNESQSLKDSINAGTIIAPEETSSTSSVTASLTRNTTDYRLDPSSGMVNNISVEFAGLGGTNRFLRYIVNSRWFYPLFAGTVFSVFGEFGYIHSVGRDVPIDEKFYLGGINTIRGYSGRTVTPYKASIVQVPSTINGIGAAEFRKVFLGGDTEAVANFEYTFPLLKDAGLKGVAFFDIGNAYDSIQNTFNRFQASYGAGIRWFSPIGPLRLEYGIPVNPRPNIDNSSGKLEFSIGSFF
ncbi:MAG TPA: outer membrane protein assembly factor BamA [Geobacteraceae bacterium]